MCPELLKLPSSSSGSVKSSDDLCAWVEVDSNTTKGSSGDAKVD